MSSFPGAKVHRTNRRKLGKGQTVLQPSAVASPTASTNTVTIAFNVPVVVNGTLNLNMSGVSLDTQVQTGPQTLVQTYSSTVIGKTWSIDPTETQVRTFQGGGVNHASGTF